MSSFVRAMVATIVLIQINSASSSEFADLLGKWTWQKFTIEVKECAGKGLCSKVVAGPKNLGMEVFASEMTRKNGDWYGQIVNPETGATYYTRLRFTDSKTWHLDGCTASKVCLSGDFVRAE